MTNTLEEPEAALILPVAYAQGFAQIRHMDPKDSVAAASSLPLDDPTGPLITPRGTNEAS